MKMETWKDIQLPLLHINNFYDKIDLKEILPFTHNTQQYGGPQKGAEVGMQSFKGLLFAKYSVWAILAFDSDGSMAPY